MLKSFYIYNYKCLGELNLHLETTSPAVMWGDSGAGKSTVVEALEILQSIGRGNGAVDRLIKPSDIGQGNLDLPVELYMEVLLGDDVYEYVVIFKPTDDFKSLIISKEILTVSGEEIYSRDGSDITVFKSSVSENVVEASYRISVTTVALTTLCAHKDNHPYNRLKSWLAGMILLSPIPSKMSGCSTHPTFMLRKDASNISDWILQILNTRPASYSTIFNYLEHRILHISDFHYETINKDVKQLFVNFDKGGQQISIPFENLSSGQKIFFLHAMVHTLSKHFTSFFCFWDGVENYLSFYEYIIKSLIETFEDNDGQLVVTTSNEALLDKFSIGNKFFLL